MLGTAPGAKPTGPGSKYPHESAGAVGGLQRRSHCAKLRPRTGVAVAGVGDHNQVWFDGLQVLVIQAEAAHDPGSKVLQDNVAYRHQFPDDFQSFFRPEVQGHAALAPVQCLKSAASFPVQFARVVAGVGTVERTGGVHELRLAGLHLDNLGP